MGLFIQGMCFWAYQSYRSDGRLSVAQIAGTLVQLSSTGCLRST